MHRIQVTDHLILNVAKGDTIAFGRFYDRYFRTVFQFAHYFIKSDFTCQEIVSDVFISLWQNRKELPEIKNLPGYLYTLTRNKALDYIDKASRIPEFTDDLPLGLTMPDNDPEKVLMFEEMEAYINKTIDKLPDRCKLIFLMSREGNLRYKDIAQILSISEKTVQAQIVTALKKIAEGIRKFGMLIL
jgi:RNA polymerase sigma-70 factor (ECF subfamily)